MDDLINRPLPDLVALLPILQARQTWLQQKHTELAGAAFQLENTLSPPTAGLVSPQTTGSVSFQFDDPLPPNPHEWLSRFHAYSFIYRGNGVIFGVTGHFFEVGVYRGFLRWRTWVT